MAMAAPVDQPARGDEGTAQVSKIWGLSRDCAATKSTKSIVEDQLVDPRPSAKVIKVNLCMALSCFVQQWGIPKHFVAGKWWEPIRIGGKIFSVKPTTPNHRAKKL